jgi:predicted RND superfamily exporter protein
MIHYLYTGSVEDTLKEQTKPVLVGALTTIGAFGGLLLTNSPLLKDFGLFALLVIAGTTLFSLVVAPHVLPRRFKPNRRAFEFLEKMNSMEKKFIEQVGGVRADIQGLSSDVKGLSGLIMVSDKGMKIPNPHEL